MRKDVFARRVRDLLPGVSKVVMEHALSHMEETAQSRAVLQAFRRGEEHFPEAAAPGPAQEMG